MKTSFWLALMFLTRLPAPRLPAVSDLHQQRVMYFFPLVGLLLGGLLGGLAWLLPTGPVALNAALLVTVWVFITGGLHIDGLADAADAWLGGLGDRDRSLAIMKDPRAGSAAVMTVACLLLVKVTALAHLWLWSSTGTLLVCVLLVPVIGRCVPALLFFTTPYARAEGLASPMVVATNARWQWGWALVCLVAVAACLMALVGLTSLWLWGVLGVQLLLLRRLMLVRLGGVTGDTVGAAVELTEMFALVMLAYLQPMVAATQ